MFSPKILRSSLLKQSRRSFALYPFQNRLPKIHADAAFVAPSADIIGDVRIAESASIWFNCTLRGDVNCITIGPRSNVQDNCVIHVRSQELDSKRLGSAPCFLGSDVTIGHSTVLHACTVEDRGFVGMGSVVMDFAVVEADSMVAAGSLVLGGTRVKSFELWGGRPAKKLRNLKKEELEGLKDSAIEYVKFGEKMKESIQ